MVSVTEALLVPEFDRLTAPVKLLVESVSVIPFAPALNDAEVAAAPCTIPPEAWVMEPPAVMAMLFRVLTVVKVGT